MLVRDSRQVHAAPSAAENMHRRPQSCEFDHAWRWPSTSFTKIQAHFGEATNSRTTKRIQCTTEQQRKNVLSAHPTQPESSHLIPHQHSCTTSQPSITTRPRTTDAFEIFKKKKTDVARTSSPGASIMHLAQPSPQLPLAWIVNAKIPFPTGSRSVTGCELLGRNQCGEVDVTQTLFFLAHENWTGCMNVTCKCTGQNEAI